MISVSCDLCGADDWFIRFPGTEQSEVPLDASAFRCTHDGYGSHTQIVECRACGYIYSNPRWDDGELLNAYVAVEDETYVHERVGREKTFAKHLLRLESCVGPGDGRDLLDVGAYIGVFVELAISRGWTAIGVEPSHWAAEIARAGNIPIIEGTLEAEELSGAQFDVITMWDVIEHVSSPSSELTAIYKLLSPGGMAVVHTMDIDSLTAKVMGGRWPWLMDMHIHYFSRKTLTKMLEDSGFEVVWIGAQGRYLSLGYIATRIGGFSGPLGRLYSWIVEKLNLEEVTVPINFGDLMTVFARKPLP